MEIIVSAFIFLLVLQLFLLIGSIAAGLFARARLNRAEDVKTSAIFFAALSLLVSALSLLEGFGLIARAPDGFVVWKALALIQIAFGIIYGVFAGCSTHRLLQERKRVERDGR